MVERHVGLRSSGVCAAGSVEGGRMMTPAPEAARFAAGGAGDLDSLESRIWAHVHHVCSPSRKNRVSTLVKVGAANTSGFSDFIYICKPIRYTQWLWMHPVYATSVTKSYLVRDTTAFIGKIYVIFPWVCFFLSSSRNKKLFPAPLQVPQHALY